MNEPALKHLLDPHCGAVSLGDSAFPQPDWVMILNKYLPNYRGMEAVYECQTELIMADFEQYAQL